MSRSMQKNERKHIPLYQKSQNTSVPEKPEYLDTGDLITKTRRCRNQHSMAFQLPSASVEAYKCSFFPQTIRDWNVLPDSLISSAVLSDDCVSKFSSLVRARD